jgi:hypothetical protein
MAEVLASQRVMLKRLGQETDDVDDPEMANSFDKHLREMESWLAGRADIEVLYVNFGEAVRDPGGQATRVNRFLGKRLDETKMAQVIEEKLYRQRKEKK